MIPDHWRHAALAPPLAWGDGPIVSGVLRSSPEDFEVDEILGFAASGEGPHALLRVRKRGANTEWVARELARAAGCKPFEVGFAGLKDRNAVTTQSFTVPRGRRAAEEFLALRGDGFEVLAAAAHQRKLPRGALEANRFAITVRQVTGDLQALGARLAAITSGGVPNYFGPQRFGRDAGNLEQVLRAAGRGAQGRQRRGPREGEGFMLSAARSVIFNGILAVRVEQGSWNRLLPGDVANLDGRGSVFAVETPDMELEQRCAALEIHPTAPLMGAGESLARGEVLALEAATAAPFSEALAVIRAARMNAERRATRIRVRDLEHELRGDVLHLKFALGTGSFATTVLREIIATSQNVDNGGE
ncbi:MAG TPA: tRNA pseudouridine(13) synthase TruD [Steroidobacteraceae bacterium]|nr:tRNA pseudouridine(13) synthase TruD [Steroidobacteraceae bacterium]